jgi:hypothetical protein
VVTERGAGVHIADQNEIPGLGQPHAGRDVRGTKDPAQHIGGHHAAGELAPNVTPTVHDIVEVAHIHPRCVSEPAMA